MNGIRFRDILSLFCCPPKPAKIVAKLAFLPPSPTYSIIHGENDACSIEFNSDATWQMGDCYKNRINVFQTTTSRRSRIVCYYIPVEKQNAYSILFSHGNAVDLGLMAGFLQALSLKFDVNIFCYDYSGYGVSTGDPLEVNIYADAEAAFEELQTRFNVPLNKIVLYGQSIGTAPTVHLATKHKVAGVILHSPLMSGIRVVCPGANRSFCFDPFTNIDKVSRIKSPTLVIHGKEDDIIDFSHGETLYERLNDPVEPLWVELAGHNDIEMYSEYADRLRRFFEDELPSFEKQKTQPEKITTTSTRSSNSSSTTSLHQQNKITDNHVTNSPTSTQKNDCATSKEKHTTSTGDVDKN